MNTQEIRINFKEFVGNEDYKEFVLSLYEAFPLREHLLFWQENKLKDFTNQAKIEPIDISDVYEVFNQCPVHNCELQAEIVPVVNGNHIVSSIPFERKMELFPLANCNAPRDLDRFDYPEKVDVFYCEKCREARKLLELNPIT